VDQAVYLRARFEDWNAEVEYSPVQSAGLTVVKLDPRVNIYAVEIAPREVAGADIIEEGAKPVRDQMRWIFRTPDGHDLIGGIPHAMERHEAAQRGDMQAILPFRL
jgi:hypothetical protein